MPIAVEYFLYGLIAFAAFMLGFGLMWPLVRFLEAKYGRKAIPSGPEEKPCGCESVITRQEIVDEAYASGGADVSTVLHPEQLHQPISLKWHGRPMLCFTAPTAA